MIRCVRLFTGADQQSHVEIGRLDLAPGRNADLVSASMSSTRVTAEETASGGTLAWHTAPARQLVVTLAGGRLPTVVGAPPRPGSQVLGRGTRPSSPPGAPSWPGCPGT